MKALEPVLKRDCCCILLRHAPTDFIRLLVGELQRTFILRLHAFQHFESVVLAALRPSFYPLEHFFERIHHNYSTS